jgi:hypothetical protein
VTFLKRVRWSGLRRFRNSTSMLGASPEPSGRMTFASIVLMITGQKGILSRKQARFVGRILPTPTLGGLHHQYVRI